MKNIYYFTFLSALLINTSIFSLEADLISTSLTRDLIINITKPIPNYSNDKYAEFNFTEEDSELYFKHVFSIETSNLITTFRIIFVYYGEDISNYTVLCTNLDESISDSDIISILRNLKASESACIDGFKREGYYDGVVRIDNEKKLLAFKLQNTNDVKFSGRVNLFDFERILRENQKYFRDNEVYTLVPYSINIQTIREKKHPSQLLFHSSTRSLQMFYAGNNVYPDKLLSGNILSIYTDPNMVKLKYHLSVI